MNSEQLGKKIREERKKLGYSAEKLGNILGITGQAILQYELNKRDIPLLTLSSLIGIFGFNWGELVNFLSDIDDLSEVEKKKLTDFIANKTRGLQFDFISNDAKQDKELNTVFSKLTANGYFVEVQNGVFRLQNKDNYSTFFLNANEVKELLKDVDNYFLARIQALEQKYKDKGTRGLW